MPRLPPELLEKILSYQTLPTLKRYHRSKELGPQLRALIGPALYKRIYFGYKDSFELLKVDISELENLASGQYSCRVAFLEIDLGPDRNFTNEVEEQTAQFLDFYKKYPDFLRSVAEVRFSGGKRVFELCSLWILENLSSLQLPMDLSHPREVHVFPENTRSLTLQRPRELFGMCKSYQWPEKLESLSLCSYNVPKLTLPESLKTLHCTHIFIHWTRFPKHLQSAHFTRCMNLRLEFFPKTLTELAVLNVSMQSLTPILRLQKLRLLRIANSFLPDISGLHLIKRLRVLDFLNSDFHLLSNVKFPKSLRAVNLLGRCHRAIDKLRFAGLEYLDISLDLECRSVFSKSLKPWPESLRVVRSAGQMVHWHKCGFPRNVTHLEASHLPKFKKPLPPFLQTLSLHYSAAYDFPHLVDRIPQSVVTLQVATAAKFLGKCELTLPNLRFLILCENYKPTRLNVDLLDFLRTHTPPLKDGEFLFRECLTNEDIKVENFLVQPVPEISLHIARRASQGEVTIPPIKAHSNVKVELQYAGKWRLPSLMEIYLA